MEDNRTIIHIVAASSNNVIGKEGGMPWRLPDDFKFFKNTTWAMPIIMGRKTLESMGGPLPGRINIVVTTDKNYRADGVSTTHSVKEALALAKDADTREIFIIGGGKIFNDTMDIVDKIYLTRVHTTIEGDTVYPEVDTGTWKRISEEDHPEDEKHNHAFTFEVWERK